MPAEESYLVRAANGTMATVVARSMRGAVDRYLRKYRPARGDLISVKLRGEGDWQDYKVT